MTVSANLASTAPFPTESTPATFVTSPTASAASQTISARPALQTILPLTGCAPFSASCPIASFALKKEPVSCVSLIIPYYRMAPALSAIPKAVQPVFSLTFAASAKMDSPFPPQEVAVSIASSITVWAAAKINTVLSALLAMNQSEGLVPSAESSTVRLASNQPAQPAVQATSSPPTTNAKSPARSPTASAVPNPTSAPVAAITSN